MWRSWVLRIVTWLQVLAGTILLLVIYSCFFKQSVGTQGIGVIVAMLGMALVMFAWPIVSLCLGLRFRKHDQLNSSWWWLEILCAMALTVIMFIIFRIKVYQ